MKTRGQNLSNCHSVMIYVARISDVTSPHFQTLISKREGGSIMKRICVLAIACLFVLSIVSVAPFFMMNAEAIEAAEFYKGKTIRWIVPFSPGGGFDTLSRLIAPFLENELQATIMVDNIKGAGGIVGSTKLFDAKPDGLTIGVIGGLDMLLASYLGHIKFDPSNYSFLSRINVNIEAWILGNKSPYKSFADLTQAKKEVKFGVTGPGSASNLGIAAICDKAHIKKKIVSGYPGSDETALATIQGEVDSCQFTWPSLRTVVESGDAKPVLVMTTWRPEDPLLNNTPSVVEVARVLGLSKQDSEDIKGIANATTVDKIIVGPPGIPADRLELLRDKLFTSLNSPKLIQKANSLGRPISPLRGEGLTALLKSANEAVKKFGYVLK